MLGIGLGDDQLAELADHLVPGLVVGDGSHAQAGGRDLTGVHRHQQAAGDERAADVRATAAVVEPHARELVDDPRRAFGRAAGEPAQQSWRRAERSYLRRRVQPLLAAGHDEPRAEAEHGGAWVSAASRHWFSRSGYSGLPSSITIEEPSSSADASAFHIIHAVVVNHISRSSGPRSQHSPWPLRCSRRMPPWPWTMAFGKPVVPEENSTYRGWSNGTCSNVSGARRQASRSSHADRVVEPVGSVRDVDHVLDAADGLADRRDLWAPIDVLVAVPVAADGEQHLRFDLTEAVDHAALAELARARRPHRAEAGAGEEGDERLRDVRHVPDDAVTRPDAQTFQAGTRPASPARSARRR